MTTESLLTGQDSTDTGIQQQNADGHNTEGENKATDESKLSGEEGQNTNDEGAEGKTNEEGKADEKVIPETYEFEMPEGVQIDTAAADEFASVAKELKLSKEEAQKVADVGAKMAQRQMEAHQNLVSSWIESVKTDKEIGGDALNENLSTARKAIDTFGSPELKELFNQWGIGNHPEVVKFAVKVGKAISDDGFVRGGNTTAPKSAAEIMYPSMSKN